MDATDATIAFSALAAATTPRPSQRPRSENSVMHAICAWASATFTALI
ncbi:hypothetical protein [Corynebacterium flavescens]